MADIGEVIREVWAEPLELPAPVRTPQEQPQRIEAPAESPELVPAGELIRARS